MQRRAVSSSPTHLLTAHPGGWALLPQSPPLGPHSAGSGVLQTLIYRAKDEERGTSGSS